MVLENSCVDNVCVGIAALMIDAGLKMIPERQKFVTVLVAVDKQIC